MGETQEETLTLEGAAERLYGDEQLRAELDDGEATAMLDWMMGQLEAAAKRNEPLAPLLSRLRALGGGLNEVVAARSGGRPEQVEERIRRLLALPRPSLGQPWRRMLRREDVVDRVVNQQASLDGPAFMRAVLAVLPAAESEKV